MMPAGLEGANEIQRPAWMPHANPQVSSWHAQRALPLAVE